MTDIFIKAEPKHVAFLNALKAAQMQHAGKLTVEEIAIIMAQSLGGVVAQLPAGTDATDLLAKNLAAGNAAMLETMTHVQHGIKPN